MIENISQGVIFTFGALSIWLISSKGRFKRWGYIAGLISQPCWVYVTYKSGQWGMFFLSIWWTIGWIKGVYNYFGKKAN